MPGALLEQPFSLQHKKGQRVQVRLREAPDGLNLKVDRQSGQFVIRWQTSANLPVESLVVISVTDVDSLEELAVRRFFIRNVHHFEPASVGAVTEALPAQAAKKVTAAATPFSANVHVNPLSNQIVSTGKTVVLTVGASANDGSQPVLHVDRLPKNASFEQNENGTYTLYWPTGDPDQGEHLFRFTAEHAKLSGVSHSRDVMIVIGDPALNQTLPAGMH